MKIIYQTFALPKSGRTLEDYEDAFFPSDPLYSRQPAVISMNRFRCVVSDGATESCFSKYWADLLVKYYGTSDGDEVRDEWLKKARADWESFISAQELPWYTEEKIDAGAFATLVGLTLSEHNTWKSRAIGDSCLFQVRNNDVIATTPLTESAEFDSFPFLLGSRQDTEEVVDEVKLSTGSGNKVTLSF